MRDDTSRVSRLHSIKTRIIMLVLFAALFTGAISSWFLLSQSNMFIEDAYGSILRQTTMGYANRLDDAIRKTLNGTLSSEGYNDIFGDIKIEGIDNVSFAVVNKDYEYLTQSNVNALGTNAASIPEIQEELKKLDGNSKENFKIKSFVDQTGTSNLSCIAVTKEDQNYLVMYFPNSVVRSQVIHMLRTASIAVFWALIILIISSIVLANSITKPIHGISALIKKTAKLDLEKDTLVEKLVKGKDETGVMAREIVTMQSNLRTVVEHILQVSDSLQENSCNLNDATVQILSTSTDNSATAEELAASMEEAAATVETIDSNTVQIKDNANNISSHATEGVNLAKEISQRAASLRNNTKKASDDTANIYRTLRGKTQEAMEQSKAVEKVNALAETIQDIANQTSLLSLNASIEAARAGELGKGFAVVAGEIGHLAAQSTATVKGIMSIVDEVNSAVHNMGDCMTETLSFLDHNVINDYNQFLEVSEQYDADAQMVSQSMDDISQLIAVLQSASEDISASISGINTTVGEAAEGVNDVAEKTTHVVELSNQVALVVDNTTKCSNHMKKLADAFHL